MPFLLQAYAQYLKPPKDLRVIAVIGVLIMLYVFFSEHVLGHQPCPLCWYQRYVWLAIIGVAVIASFGKMPVMTLSTILLLLAGTALATHHSGIEVGWWKGFGTCNVSDTDLVTDTIDGLREMLYSTNIVRCDAVTWSFFGLSMANYNALVSFAAAIGLTANRITL